MSWPTTSGDVQLCLAEINATWASENCAPDMSSYTALSTGWRGTGDCPTESAIETAWVTVNASKQMDKMRAERDVRLQAIMWRVERYNTQIALGETPDDDSTKMTAINQYLQDLRDMPQDNPSVADDAAYDALTWPTEPE